MCSSSAATLCVKRGAHVSGLCGCRKVHVTWEPAAPSELHAECPSQEVKLAGSTLGLTDSRLAAALSSECQAECQADLQGGARELGAGCSFRAARGMRQPGGGFCRLQQGYCSKLSLSHLQPLPC